MIDFNEVLQNISEYNSFQIPKLEDEEKERIISKTSKKINSERKVIMKKKIAVLVAAILSISIVASATTLFVVNDSFIKYFGKSNVENVLGENLAISTNTKGVKITAQQVIGDDFGVYILLESEGKNISDKTFEEVVVKSNTEILQNSDIIPMGNKDNNHSSFIIHVSSTDKLYGKNIEICFKNIGSNEIDKKTGKEIFKLKKSGIWKLKWKLNYTPNEKSIIDINKEISIYGGKGLWNNAVITPLSATVNIKEKEDFEIHCNEPNDCLVVKLNDGTIIRSDYADATDVIHDTTSITMYFKRIVKYSDILSITFANEEIILHNNPNVVPRKLFVDSDRNFTIDMTAKLYDILSPIETKIEYDKKLKTDVTRYIFYAKHGNDKTTLFEISAYNGEFSKKKMEEEKPMEEYIVSADNLVYTIIYAQPETESDIKLYSQIFNSEVLKIKNRINILNGSSQQNISPTQKRLDTVDFYGILTDYYNNELTYMSCEFLIEGEDDKRIAEIKNMGYDVEMSNGHAIWWSEELNISLKVSKDVKVKLLDNNNKLQNSNIKAISEKLNEKPKNFICKMQAKGGVILYIEEVNQNNATYK